MTDALAITPELKDLSLVKMPSQRDVLAWVDFDTLPAVRARHSEELVPTKLLKGALALAVWCHHPDLKPEKGMGARKLSNARKHRDEWLAALADEVDRADFAELIEALAQGWIKQREAPESDALIIIEFATAFAFPQVVRVLDTWLDRADAKISNLERRRLTKKLPEEVARLAEPILKSFAAMETPDSIHALVARARLDDSGQRRAQARVILDAYGVAHGLNEWDVLACMSPTLGLDEDTPIRHDLDGRVLEFRVDDTGHVHVTDVKTNKAYKRFPGIKKSDDKPSYYKAKRHHDVLSREVSALFDLHRHRLLRALVTQRTWSIAQWRAHVGSHRLLAPSTRSIVWSVTRPGTEDPVMVLCDGEGGFFDIDTETLQFTDDARITVAHPVDIPDEAQKRWSGHLADFEVLRTIDQFERLVFPRPRALEVIHDSPQKLHRDTINALCEEAWQLGEAVKNKGYKGHYYTAPSIHLDLDVGKLELVFSGNRPLKLDTHTLRPRSAKTGPVEWMRIRLDQTRHYTCSGKGVVEIAPPDAFSDAALSELARLLFLGAQNRHTDRVQFHVSG